MSHSQFQDDVVFVFHDHDHSWSDIQSASPAFMHPSSTLAYMNMCRSVLSALMSLENTSTPIWVYICIGDVSAGDIDWHISSIVCG